MREGEAHAYGSLKNKVTQEKYFLRWQNNASTEYKIICAVQ